jgi:flavin-dependent dehydrogenase
MAGAGVPSDPLRSRKRPVIGLGTVLPEHAPGFPAGVIHMAVGNEGYVGFVRVEDGSLNTAAAVCPLALRAAESPTSLINSLLRQAGWPEIEEASVQKWTGTPELTRRPRRPGAERLFAVGDAGGYLEPFTGEGMFWALAGASYLAPLAAQGTERWTMNLLDDWTATHARLVGRAQRLCRASAWVLARPPLARLTLRMLGAHPGLARSLVRRVGAPIVT